MIPVSPNCAPTSPTGRMSTHCQHGYRGCNTILCTCACHDDEAASAGETKTSNEEDQP